MNLKLGLPWTVFILSNVKTLSCSWGAIMKSIDLVSWIKSRLSGNHGSKFPTDFNIFSTSWDTIGSIHFALMTWNLFVTLVASRYKIYIHSPYNQSSQQQVQHSKTPEVKPKPSFQIGIDSLTQTISKLRSILHFSHTSSSVENHASRQRCLYDMISDMS